MTPKEKARELVHKMYAGFVHDLYSYKAKQCAIIAVDEILKLGKKIPLETLEYYVEVKNEINKL